VELIAYLSQLRSILESICDCLEREQEALISEDPNMLLEIIEEKKRCVDELARVEEMRNGEYPGLSISRLAEEGRLTPEIEAVGADLRALTERASKLQETNRLLMQKSKEYADKIISMLHGASKNTYGSDGKIKDSQKLNSVLDSSV